MTNEMYKERMKQVLVKASDVSEMCLTWCLVSTDPDCVAEFGCDADGNLVLMGDSFPLKISDLTNIRYHWNPEWDYDGGFIRFDFGKEIHLDCWFDDCSMGDLYHVRYYDVHKTGLNRGKAIAFLEEMKNKYVG